MAVHQRARWWWPLLRPRPPSPPRVWCPPQGAATCVRGLSKSCWPGPSRRADAADVESSFQPRRRLRPSPRARRFSLLTPPLPVLPAAQNAHSLRSPWRECTTKFASASSRCRPWLTHSARPAGRLATRLTLRRMRTVPTFGLCSRTHAVSCRGRA